MPANAIGKLNVPYVDRPLSVVITVEASSHYTHSESQGRQEYQLVRTTSLENDKKH